MKGKVIAISIFIFIITCLCVFELIFTNSTIGYLKEKSNEVIISIKQGDDKETVLSYIDELDKRWIANEDLLCLIYNHKDMVEIGKEVEQAKSYVKLDNNTEALVHLDLLREDIYALEHIISFAVFSIF